MSKMTDEEKKAAEEAAKAEADAVALEEKDPLQPDYKAIAEAEKKRADEAEKAAADLAFKMRDKKRKTKDEDADDEPEDDEDKPLTKRELAEMLAKNNEETKKSSQETDALSIARSITSSEDEAQAAFLHWKNRVRPTGDLRADVQFAVGGINHTRVLAQNSELKRALAGRDSAETDPTGSRRDPSEAPGPKLDAMTKAVFESAGFKYDPKVKAWKKQLPNGKFVIKDPATGKVRPL